jgi:hypothetical protein
LLHTSDRRLHRPPQVGAAVDSHAGVGSGIVVVVDPVGPVVVVALQTATPSLRHCLSVWRLHRLRLPPASTQASMVAPHACLHSLRRESAPASSGSDASRAKTANDQTAMRMRRR